MLSASGLLDFHTFVLIVVLMVMRRRDLHYVGSGIYDTHLVNNAAVIVVIQ